ncbi:glycoside hydrolase family 2 protein [Chitinophaga rhizophila]|uniref:Glycoside hydrolase family 2 n=1 Tax=Chitinophaga rhizophila TaxID=2866212 RepID=A0ABS7G739_9BACT|nr:sugar-binding domain-containing protein [Chitinophaga rhizophila]MBW8683472.1 glycoside hydrolase family 2 [Chitinophaga rhizophila]
MNNKLNFLSLLFLWLLVSNYGIAQVQLNKVKDPELITRWTKDVIRSEQPLSEYPRPQMTRGNWRCLNGTWDFSITPVNEKMPTNFERKILVPFPLESSLSGVKENLTTGKALWYNKIISFSKRDRNGRILLHFGAVDWKATVYVNNKEIGEHIGGYTSFTFDITKDVKEGNNSITVKVEDPTDLGYGPHGKQSTNPDNIYYTSVSGIWQTVWLEYVPINYISDVKLRTNIDSQTVSITARSAKTNDIQISIFEEGRLIANKIGRSNHECNVYIKKPRLWSPNDPFLYDVEIKLITDGHVDDSVQSYAGMRKVSLQKDQLGYSRIFLNDKYIYNLGVLDQGYWPDGLYTAPTDEALKFDLQVEKALGFNTVRKHIKVEPARWYYHADKLGLLVWQDFVNPNQALPEGSKVAFEKQIKETISQLWNSPSIITWVIFNEKWGQYDQERLTNMVRDADPYRLVNGHSGELLYVNNVLRSPSPNAYVNSDIVDVHSYPYPKDPPIVGQSVKVVGEFGGFAMSVDDHIWDDMKGGWGYNGLNSQSKLTKEYSDCIDTLVKLEKQGLSGSIYTQPFDVETELNGLMTYDREILKIPIGRIRDLNSKLNLSLNGKSDQILQFDVYDEKDDFKSMDEMRKRFSSGRNDSSFLRKYTSKLLSISDSIEYNKVSKKYIEMIVSPFMTVNIKYLEATAKRPNDYSFDFICKNYSNLNKLFEGKRAISKVRGIIEYDIYRNIQNDTNYAFDKRRLNQILNEYGIISELPMLKQLALFYYTRYDISNFVRVKDSIHKKYPGEVSIFDMNNDAWLVFERSNNKNELESALNWSKNVISSEKTGNYYDTYANLLYKLGRTNEAIKFQEIATELPPGNGSQSSIKSSLSKMKQGLPTWQ